MVTWSLSLFKHWSLSDYILELPWDVFYQHWLRGVCGLQPGDLQSVCVSLQVRERGGSGYFLGARYRNTKQTHLRPIVSISRSKTSQFKMQNYLA